MNTSFIRSHAKSFGVAAQLHSLLYRGVNKVFLYQALRGLWITLPDLDQAFLEAPPQYEARFLEPHELMGTVRCNKYELSAEFVRHALEKGDKCYAILDGETVASYGWYSLRPTALSEELVLHFDPSFAYMYKGFTLPEYRGQRLHAIGMSRALREYTELGCKGMVSYVESNNFPSLRSCYRMGYKNFGTIYFARMIGQYLIYGTPGCLEFGFRVAAVRG
jgi:hypothetical protein